MALEFPSAIIDRIQSRLRSEAGIPSFDPDRPSAHLPSLEEAIAGSEPSPPYLRCSQCRGRLLRGIQSMICVYCGSVQCRSGPPPSLSFNTTSAYRRLLESLQADGSDPVIFSNATGDSGSGPNASTDGLVLSDLLDIEIKWPEFSTNVQNVTTIRELETSAPSLNLTGVDLDNFFANVVTEVPQSAVEEHSVANKQAVSTESHVFSDQDNLSMFQSFQSSDVAVKSGDVTGSKSGDSTLWEAEFQSASSGTVPVGLKSADLFLGSSPDLLRPIDTDVTAASNSGTDAKFEISNQDDGEYKNKQNLTSPINDDWGQNHIWGTSNAKIPSKTDQFDINSKTTDSNLKNDLNNVSSVSDYCMQDDLLMTSSTSITAKSEKAKGDEDSFGSWQHFTSSGNIVGKGSMGGNTDVDGMEFGGFAQPDLFAGSSSIQKGVADVNTIQSENFPLGRMEEDAMKGRGAITQTGSTGNSSSANTVAISVDSNLEMLMSQMPDLSFMLDNKLSIPSKPKGTDSML